MSPRIMCRKRLRILARSTVTIADSHTQSGQLFPIAPRGGDPLLSLDARGEILQYSSIRRKVTSNIVYPMLKSSPVSERVCQAADAGYVI
jgi:hypothetical protein